MGQKKPVSEDIYHLHFQIFEISGCYNVTTHQRVAGLVLVDGPHSCPVELLEQLEAWCVEGVFTWNHTEEVGEMLLGEHRVCVSVGQLQHGDNVIIYHSKPSRRLAWKRLLTLDFVMRLIRKKSGERTNHIHISVVHFRWRCVSTPTICCQDANI